MAKEAGKPKTPSPRKTLESMKFESGHKTMRIELVEVLVGAAGAPFRVRASVIEGKKVTTSGYVSLEQTLDNGKSSFVDACQQARKDGWAPATSKRSSRMKVLSALPKP